MSIRVCLLLLNCAVLFSSAFCQSVEGIRFEGGTWADILKKAQQNGKPVFVDVYTSWCIPCRKMSAEVFVLPAVADRFNSAFVNYKFDAEKGEGIEIAKRYRVGAFPTYLFVKPDGTLIHRSVGYMPADKFLSETALALREASDPRPLASWEEEYQTKRQDTTFVWDYLQKRKRLGLDNADVADHYASLLDRSSLLRKGVIMKLLQMERINTDGFLLSFIRANRSDVLTSIEPSLRGRLDDHLSSLVLKDVERAATLQDDSLLHVITEFLKASSFGDIPAAWRAHEAEMKYHAHRRDSARLAKAFLEYSKAVYAYDPAPLVAADSMALARFEADLASGKITVKPESLAATRRQRGSTRKTSYAYRVRDVARGAYYGLQDKDLLKEALGLIDLALQYSDNFSIHEVRAGILYKMGDRAGGIQWMRKTIENYANMSRELNLSSDKITTRLEETLKKMTEGKPTWGVEPSPGI
jgi:thiol-disulfide isomerase/thioredoxin